jgi:hypothetical protein
MLASTSTPEPLGTPTIASNADCSSASNWTIEYHRTGGFGGFDQSLTVKSNGSLAIHSKNPPLDKQVSVPKDHIESITDVLVKACPFELVREEGVCADCYSYELNIQIDSKRYSVQALDTNLSEELRPLVTILDQFLQGTGQ